MAGYRDIYWSENPDLGEEIARRLFEEGKVEQPRKLTNTHQHPGIANGHWKNRRWAFYFTDGSVYYATGVSADSAYQKIEGVLDDMDEDDECSDEVEILEGTPELDNFEFWLTFLNLRTQISRQSWHRKKTVKHIDCG